MKRLYVIRDRLAGFGIVPTGVPAVLDMPSDAYALRMLKGSVAKGQQPNLLNTNAEDKELWCVGELDELTGKIEAFEPYLIGRAIDYLNREVIEDEEGKE